MRVEIDKSFQKDARKISDGSVLKKIADVIIDIQKAENISQIKNLKKLKGSQNHYRIKIGDYRMGIIISGSAVECVRCLHRKDIYRFFPK